MISVSLWYVLDLLIIINKTIITAICCTNVYRIRKTHSVCFAIKFLLP